jgi:signal transduction histidine kinase
MRDSAALLNQPALATGQFAELYRKKGLIDSSFYYSRLSMMYALKANRLDIIRSLKMNFAYLFQERGLSDSAFYYCYSALKDSKNAPDTLGMMDAALLLSELYKSKKKFDSAYSYLSYYTTLNKNFQTTEKIKRTQSLAFNEVLYQNQLEQERKEAKQQYESKVKIYGLLGAFAVMLLIGIILYRNNIQKQKAKLKIEKAYEQLQATQAQLIQSEKMASLGELTAGIAHEIQNPLNFVNNFSEVNNELIEEINDESDVNEIKAIANDIKQNNEKIAFHGKRADAIVKGMLQHSRASTEHKEPTDINALADEYLRLSYHGLRAKDKDFNATLQTDFDESIGKINVVPQDIGRVLLNLFNNAFYAVQEKAKKSGAEYQPVVTVKTKKNSANMFGSNSSPLEAHGLAISVRDNGIGIPQKVVDKIFHPFFTTKPTGQGTGLGLSLSYDIIKAHGGEIRVETKEGEGCEFMIWLPLKEAFNNSK